MFENTLATITRSWGDQSGKSETEWYNAVVLRFRTLSILYDYMILHDYIPEINSPECTWRNHTQSTVICDQTWHTVFKKGAHGTPSARSLKRPSTGDCGHWTQKKVSVDAKVRILDIPEQNVQGEEDRWNDPIGTTHLENQACIQRCAKHPWGRPSVSLPKKFVADPFPRPLLNSVQEASPIRETMKSSFSRVFS